MFCKLLLDLKTTTTPSLTPTLGSMKCSNFKVSKSKPLFCQIKNQILIFLVFLPLWKKIGHFFHLYVHLPHDIFFLAFFWFFYKGLSINDVTPIFLFLDPPPSPCHPNYALKITPNHQFLYPPPSPSGMTSFMDVS